MPLFQALHPGDLKKAVVKQLDRLLDPIRKEFESPELKALLVEAYPEEKKKKKKKAAPSQKKAASAADDGDLMSPNRLDIRVGRITDVRKVRVVHDICTGCCVLWYRV